MACGKHHTVALSTQGDVYTWGHGKEGALGLGEVTEVDIATKVDGLSNITQIEAGNDFTVAQNDAGKVFSFGKNQYGQLGQRGDNLHKMLTPTVVNLSRLHTPLYVSAGEEHCSMVSKDG